MRLGGGSKLCPMSIARKIKPHRACIFCGGTYKMSDEHLIPNWVRRVVPRVGQASTHMQFRVASLGEDVVLIPEINVFP